MSHKRHVWGAISNLAERLVDLPGDGLARLEKEVGKLGREQFKSNTLAQAQAERLDAALAALRDETVQGGAARRQAADRARAEVLQSLLPILDGLEAGLESGLRQAGQLEQEGNPAGELLLAWLDGQRLLRDRLLALLREAGIRPIEAVGLGFDPYRHVAVGTVRDETLPEGQIVAEDRRGYTAGDQVLRYAEVLVVKNHEKE